MPRLKPEDLEPVKPASSFGSSTSSSFSAASSSPKYEETVITTRRGDSDSVSGFRNAPPAARADMSNNVGDADVLVKNTNEDWINKKWRPAMGWIYMLTCTFDFVIAPILWSILQAVQGGQVTNQWQPLTLQGAGLYHIAMGAVLGIAAYGRTKEKVEGRQ
jgi:Holin of 3TMs, for gene-transfer release